MRVYLLTLCACLAVSLAVIPKRHVDVYNYFLADAPEFVPSNEQITFYYDQQRVDHFDPNNHAVWKQRYMVNSTFFNGEGPVFALLGCEGPISERGVTGHFRSNRMAQKFGGLIISMEHRFYGESIPTEDVSVENLRFLTAEQSLEDFVQLLEWYFEDHNLDFQKNKVVAVGGSYCGNLAAWARIKYPHIFYAAEAHSAPVLLKADYTEYFEVDQSALRDAGGDECVEAMTEGFRAVNDALKSGDDTRKEEVRQKLNVPFAPPTIGLDLEAFMSSLTDGFAGIIQYSRGDDVKQICDALKTSNDPLENMGALMRHSDVQFAETFEDTWAEIKNDFKDYDPSQPDQVSLMSARSWTWQTCTEYAYWQTRSEKVFDNQVGPSLAFFENTCEKVYGIQAPTAFEIAYSNMIYGGRSPVVRRTWLPNGSYDPWHALGVKYAAGEEHVKSLPDTDYRTDLFMQTSHCAIMYDFDAAGHPELVTDEMRRAYKIEEDLLTSWLE